MYNRRLKITQEDYNKLLESFDWLLSHPDILAYNQPVKYFEIAKKESYSETRIFFDFYHVLMSWSMKHNQEIYFFLRELDLTDNQLESALKNILPEKLAKFK